VAIEAKEGDSAQDREEEVGAGSGSQGRGNEKQDEYSGLYPTRLSWRIELNSLREKVRYDNNKDKPRTFHGI